MSAIWSARGWFVNLNGTCGVATENQLEVERRYVPDINVHCEIIERVL